MSETVRVQIMFDEPTKYGNFRDAIYMTIDDYNAAKQDDIDALKQERVDNYITAVDTKPVPPALTKAELQKLADSLVEQKDSLDAQIAEINEKIASK